MKNKYICPLCNSKMDFHYHLRYMGKDQKYYYCPNHQCAYIEYNTITKQFLLFNSNGGDDGFMEPLFKGSWNKCCERFKKYKALL